VSELLHHVEQSILARQLIRSGQRVLVAVSGGVDSLVLLHVLHELARRHEWQLTAAHLNHRLRGRSSDADEQLVRRTAARLKLPVVVEAADVRELARAQKLSLEMAARKLRHDFLARAARRRHIPIVALAHHADDQLELFFLRLLRGSGGEGLAGMKWRNLSPGDTKVQLVRPLLDQPKAVLAEHAAEQGIRYREDASNALMDFQRNRIRHELLPLLRSKYQPALDRTIARVMDIVGAESEFAGQAAREWLRGLGSPKAEGQGKSEVRSPKSEEARASLRRLLRRRRGVQNNLPFEDLPVAVQRRCVQMQLRRLGIEADFEVVEKLRDAEERAVTIGLGQARPWAKATGTGGGEGAATTSKGDWEARAGGIVGAPVLRYAVRDRWGKVRLQNAAVEGFNFSAADVDLEGRAGEVEFDGARISWQIDLSKAGAQPRAAGIHEFFDADKVGSPIRLRHWQQGDRFQPIGMASAIKLQDFFTNQKVPRDRRRQLVVAATARGEVYWVEGMRISERFKLTRQTIRRLHWRWKRL
jgi:tRNA(Ile)-lysidine synthase